HDSIGLGEDGPTHQPVEHLAGLRAIPGLDVIRPADANEVTEAWRAAMDRHHQPVALVLTRQDVPIIDRSKYASADGLRRGGYVIADPDGGDPEVILIATGSEVALALGAHEQLISDGVRSRVVSLPCWELFERQDQSYQDEVLPPSIQKRVSVEEASTLGWIDSSAPKERRSACTRSAPPLRSRTFRQSSGSPRTRWPRGPRRYSDDEAHAGAPRTGAEPLARQHHPHDARRRDGAGLHRRV